ncbi:MAG: cell division protein FtsX [Candidatus Dormibacter sp.]|uniref:cell division protein FtsX n=1 Tax=Candidatus Dormibacter sp. TaxID=2973982 RepID=UPI000DB471E8|nr:MAG: hypothetical protein DLM66_09895 [Candidatus Dormibacteraeota bacterium]
MGPVVLKAPFPRRTVYLTVVRNVLHHLFFGAAVSWARNLAGTAPALISMTLLLILAGVVGLGGFALHLLADRESSDAAVLHVYLSDDASPTDVDALRVKLSADSRVRSVSYTSKADALKKAQNRPGLGDLASGAGSNPFPASLDVKLKRVEDVSGVADSVSKEKAIDPVQPTSYDPGAYGRLQKALTYLAVGGGAFLAIFGLVAVLVTSNSIQSAIHARREEISIMGLVGAPNWMIRGPFLFEGALTGGIAGLIAGLLVSIGAGVGATVGGSNRLGALVPGFTVSTGVAAGLILLLVGILLGAAASLIGLRRHLMVPESA